VRGERHVAPLQDEIGQDPIRHLPDGPPVRHRTHEPLQLGGSPIRVGGGEPQAVASRGDAEGVVPVSGLPGTCVGQVVGLVQDQEVEPGAFPLQEGEGGVVGGHRDAARILFVAVEGPDLLAPEGVGELAEPLVEEGAGGGDHAGACADPADGHEGDQGLARPGGKDHGAPACRAPCIGGVNRRCGLPQPPCQGLLLVRTGHPIIEEGVLQLVGTG
jgi:hypothetical protein